MKKIKATVDWDVWKDNSGNFWIGTGLSTFKWSTFSKVLETIRKIKAEKSNKFEKEIIFR